MRTNLRRYDVILTRKTDERLLLRVWRAQTLRRNTRLFNGWRDVVGRRRKQAKRLALRGKPKLRSVLVGTDAPAEVVSILEPTPQVRSVAVLTSTWGLSRSSHPSELGN